MAGTRAATFIGAPCKKCGQSLRYSCNGDCVACAKRRAWIKRTSKPNEHRAQAKYYRTRWQRRYYQRKYNLDPGEVETLLQQQGNACAICGSIRSQQWHVDHDHATNVYRGILCGSCNRGLGLFKDNPEFLRKAIAYLEKPQIKVEELLERRQRSLFLIKG